MRDTDFPVRLREYMKVACNRSPGFSRSITEDNGFDWRVSVKKRDIKTIDLNYKIFYIVHNACYIIFYKILLSMLYFVIRRPLYANVVDSRT